MNALDAIDNHIALQERLIQRQQAKFQRRSARGKTTHPPKGQEDLEATRKARDGLVELVSIAREVVRTDDAALLELRNLGIQAPLETHELTNKLRNALEPFKGSLHEHP